MTGNEELSEISGRITDAYNLQDTDGFLRSLYDLESLGYKNICVESYFIGIHGEKLKLKLFLKGGFEVIAPGTTGAFKVIWTLRFKHMMLNGTHEYIKHINEMSPEEYKWAKPSRGIINKV